MNVFLINTVLLPGAIGVIMFGLGMSLTAQDFRRVLAFPRAVVTGLVVQTVVLVAVAFAVTKLYALPPALAVGLMLLAATPGGALANVFSHLARGDVALNVTLIAINSGVALAWVPLVLDRTLRHFYGAGRYVPPPTAKILEVATIIVLPVVLGMIVRRLALGFALRAERPVRLASIVLLAIVVVVSIYTAQGELLANFAAVGLACLTFNLVSMSTGYLVPRAVGLEPRQAIAISFEIGVHNAAIAIYVAYAILNDPVIGVPAALYGLIQLSTASLLVYALRRQRQAAAEPGRA